MTIKPTQLIIKNIGKIADMTIDINKPLILFYGEIRQGKSTILNAVRWVCGGPFPDDIIKHGEKEGSIELRFDGGMIGRSYYRAKDDTTKARAVTFIRGGKPVPSPVNEIKRFLNPFLLDQDFLRNKTELERKQYFTELFSVDTTELDTELFNSQREAQSLRAKIGGYGEIDLTKIDPVDATSLKNELAKVRADWATKKAGLESELETIRKRHSDNLETLSQENSAIRDHNATFTRGEEANAGLAKEIDELETKLIALREKYTKTAKWLREHPKQSEKPAIANPDTTELRKKIADAPDTSGLESKIQEAGAVNVRAEQYRSNKDRSEAKKADEKKLVEMEKRQREIKAEKQAKLKTVSDSCGIAGLAFDEAGNFIYQDTTAGMISDSQIMRLSSELSALYPEGFGLDLIDRAESLGKSIFEFVDRAKAEKKTILATIVGERPAKVPPEIGVFVVEDGKATGV